MAKRDKGTDRLSPESVFNNFVIKLGIMVYCVYKFLRDRPCLGRGEQTVQVIALAFSGGEVFLKKYLYNFILNCGEFVNGEHSDFLFKPRAIPDSQLT